MCRNVGALHLVSKSDSTTYTCIDHDDINKHSVYVTLNPYGINRFPDFSGHSVKSGCTRLYQAALLWLWLSYNRLSLSLFMVRCTTPRVSTPYLVTRPTCVPHVGLATRLLSTWLHTHAHWPHFPGLPPTVVAYFKWSKLGVVKLLGNRLWLPHIPGTHMIV